MVEVVAALIWDKDKFMICQRPAHKARGLLWEFVGGKAEPGETKDQALIRECREELAITLSVGDVFMDVTHEYPDLTVHLTLFNAVIAAGVPQKLEHNDIKWITPAEIPNFEFCPADEEILEKIKNCHEERNMDIKRAKEIISALAEGIDPMTGEVLEAGNVCNKVEVVRAFYAVLRELDQKSKKGILENAGKPWTLEEEEHLIELYNKGLSKKAISKELGRTPGSISSRLDKLEISDD